jgi:hypothetical protein
VNKADPTEFILEKYDDWEMSVRICKLIEKTIIIGDMININSCTYSFYDTYAYSINWLNEDGEDIEVSWLFIYI